jgi:hypothetical protein
MADQRQFLEEWTAVTPVDFGLQAAYWTRKAEDEVSFRPIVGWLTFNSREVGSSPDAPFYNGFAAVVIGDFFWPVMANLIANFGGTVPKDMDPAMVKAQIAEWDAAGPELIRFTGRGVAKA